ncbi:hypothetical protein DFH09DRAFT_1081218 [Mycena vulgaris]|nr:hypothetical protein DFH09DRAFT_1081218 [Mycena vulgaris]
MQCDVSCAQQNDALERNSDHIAQIMAVGNITAIASDGEAERGAALVQQAMNRDLSPQSPIYPLLSVPDLMNLRVGEDDVTSDKDYPHVLKTLRNLSMRLKGVQVRGFVITGTPTLIKAHLHAAGHSQQQVNAFLNPNDKQDVDLGYQFLKALWSKRGRVLDTCIK